VGYCGFVCFGCISWLLDKGVDRMEKVVVSKAQSTHQLIVKIKKDIHTYFMSLAVCLKTIKSKEYYLELGYDSFEEYTSSPEIDLTVNRCNKLIRIYNRWVEDYGYKVKELEGIDTEKLDIAQSQATEEDKGEWLEKARLLSRADLRALTPGCKHYRKPLEIICPYCGRKFLYEGKVE